MGLVEERDRARDLAARLEAELHREVGTLRMRVDMRALSEKDRVGMRQVYQAMRRAGYGRATTRMYVAGMVTVLGSAHAVWSVRA